MTANNSLIIRRRVINSSHCHTSCCFTAATVTDLGTMARTQLFGTSLSVNNSAWAEVDCDDPEDREIGAKH